MPASGVSLLRPYVGAAAGFSLVMNLLVLIPAIFMLQVFDRVLPSGSTETLVMLLVLAGGGLLCMAYLDVIRSRLLAAGAIALEKRLGTQVLAEMIRRRNIPGEDKAQNSLADLHVLRGFLTGPVLLALLDAPWLPVYIVVICLFHPLLGALAGGGALLLVGLACINERLARPALARMQADSRNAARFVDQALANAEASRALGMVGGIARAWHALSCRVLANQLQANRVSSLLASLTRFSRQLLQVGMLALSAWLVLGQQATPGIMIAATILLARALAPVETLIGAWSTLVEGQGAYARLKSLLCEPQLQQTRIELPPLEGRLSAERLLFGFRGDQRPVIKNLSFELAPGETLAIVGPSASGKSTLARLLLGVWKPAAGTVRLDGAEVHAWPAEVLGRQVGYLPQDVELFAGTVGQNIARMGEPDSELVVEAARRAGAHELVLKLPAGYDTDIGHGGGLLSGGQRQRIALARALYGAPKLEPNSNLDAEGEAALANAVRSLKAAGATVVFITHRSGLLSLADRIMVLRDGTIEQLGPGSQVLVSRHRPGVRVAAVAPAPLLGRA